MSNIQTLRWLENKNSFRIDCSLDIAIHSFDSGIIMLIIPGVDGTLDGYENKYIRIAEQIQNEQNIAVIRMSNPFISSFHWESNIRMALDYIDQNRRAITGNKEIEIRIMAISVGATVVAGLAWEYPQITRLLLINPATKLWSEKIASNLSEFKNGPVVVVSGELDESSDLTLPTLPNIKKVVVKNADHHFSGEAFDQFLNLPAVYLFDSDIH